MESAFDTHRQEDFMKFLDREVTIAKPGFNRWLVPPAALAVHLAIGQIYAYSVFNASADQAYRYY